MKRIALAVWSFIVGDDWVVAAGVVIAGATTAALQGLGIAAWWLIPVMVVALLARSAARARGSGSGSGSTPGPAG